MMGSCMPHTHLTDPHDAPPLHHVWYVQLSNQLRAAIDGNKLPEASKLLGDLKVSQSLYWWLYLKMRDALAHVFCHHNIYMPMYTHRSYWPNSSHYLLSIYKRHKQPKKEHLEVSHPSHHHPSQHTHTLVHRSLPRSFFVHGLHCRASLGDSSHLSGEAKR